MQDTLTLQASAIYKYPCTRLHKTTAASKVRATAAALVGIRQSATSLTLSTLETPTRQQSHRGIGSTQAGDYRKKYAKVRVERARLIDNKLSLQASIVVVLLAVLYK